jgi:hypothetical protein
MKYEDIYSRFYLKQTDPSLFKCSKEDAYEIMSGWLHSIASLPYVRKCFSNISFDDDLEELTYSLVKSVDTDSDNEFVTEVFAQGMVICWMRPEVEKAINLAIAIGGKEEKSILNNYKTNIARLDSLELKLKKMIRDYGYNNGSYETE